MKMPFIHDDTRLVVNVKTGETYFFVFVSRRLQSAIVQVKDITGRKFDIPLNPLNVHRYRFER